MTAYSDDGVIMGLRHRACRSGASNSTPESISTEHSLALLGNFTRLTREWADARLKPRLLRTLSSGTPSTGTLDPTPSRSRWRFM